MTWVALPILDMLLVFFWSHTNKTQNSKYLNPNLSFINKIDGRNSLFPFRIFWYFLSIFLRYKWNFKWQTMFKIRDHRNGRITVGVTERVVGNSNLVIRVSFRYKRKLEVEGICLDVLVIKTKAMMISFTFKGFKENPL